MNYALAMVLTAIGMGSLPFLWKWGFKKPEEGLAERALRKASLNLIQGTGTWEGDYTITLTGHRPKPLCDLQVIKGGWETCPPPYDWKKEEQS